MLLNTLTLAERERLAYAEGFTTTAALLARASDDSLDLDAAQDDGQDLKDQLFTMRELVEQAADYLKAGDVDRAACTLSEALK
jgi:hypothetical protein